MIRLLVLSLTLLSLVTTASAEEPPKNPPVVLITGAMSYGTSLTSGTHFPPAIVHGVGMLVPLKNDWGYYSEIAFTTSLSEFKPGFQVITGPSRRLNDRINIGVTGMYKLIPAIDDAVPMMNVVGFSAAPILPTSFGSVSLPCGVGYNVTIEDFTVGCNVKAATRLK